MCAVALLAFQPARQDAARVGAIRLTQNPLIAVDTSPSLGDNVNGPSIIRVRMVCVRTCGTWRRTPDSTERRTT